MKFLNNNAEEWWHLGNGEGGRFEQKTLGHIVLIKLFGEKVIYTCTHDTYSEKNIFVIQNI